MKQIITLFSLAILINCVKMEDISDFKEEYQREICDKFSLYANTMDVEGSILLYTDDAVVNGNGSEPVKGIDQIRQDFVDWYESSETINHSAKVISAQVFGNKAFAYGKWKVDRTSKEGERTTSEGYWSTHNIKVGGTWKMTIDHTNDL